MARSPGSLRRAGDGLGMVGAVVAAHRRDDYDARRREDAPWRRLYGTQRWKNTRADQLAREPLCRMCLDQGVVTAATVCDHRDPHRGDLDKFWNGPFQSLCKPHHDSEKQREERGPAGV